MSLKFRSQTIFENFENYRKLPGNRQKFEPFRFDQYAKRAAAQVQFVLLKTPHVTPDGRPSVSVAVEKDGCHLFGADILSAPVPEKHQALAAFRFAIRKQMTPAVPTDKSKGFVKKQAGDRFLRRRSRGGKRWLCGGFRNRIFVQRRFELNEQLNQLLQQ